MPNKAFNSDSGSFSATLLLVASCYSGIHLRPRLRGRSWWAYASTALSTSHGQIKPGVMAKLKDNNCPILNLLIIILKQPLSTHIYEVLDPVFLVFRKEDKCSVPNSFYVY